MKEFLWVLTLYIVQSIQLRSTVEDVHFRALIHQNDPRLLLPSRSKLTHSLSPELYREAKLKLMQKLSAVKGFLSLQMVGRQLLMKVIQRLTFIT
jgi:hypothetical protein